MTQARVKGKQQCPTCKDWYAHGFCGNCERVLTDVQPLDVGEVIKREGWFCTSCGHRHAGPTLANICVGCSCPVTEHTTAEDDWIRIASENAKDATARLEAVQKLYEQALDQRDSALVELTDTRRFWEAAKYALYVEKIECERLRVALREIAEMDLQHAQAKNMHDRAVAAVPQPEMRVGDVGYYRVVNPDGSMSIERRPDHDHIHVMAGFDPITLRGRCQCGAWVDIHTHPKPQPKDWRAEVLSSPVYPTAIHGETDKDMK